MKRVLIVHFANLQIRQSPEFAGHFTKIDQLTSLCNDISDAISRTEADSVYVVLSGDVSMSGKTEEYAAAETFLKSLLAATNISPEKLIIVPGNHDRCWQLESSQQLEPFKKFAAHMDCSAEQGFSIKVFPEDRITFIGIDSTVPKRINTFQPATGYISQRNLRLLATQLRGYNLSDHTLCVALHHCSDVAFDENHRLKNAATFQRFLDEWKVDIVLHGHAHSGNWIAKESVYGRQLVAGAGMLSGERWRGLAESPYYNLLLINDGKKVCLQSRMIRPEIPVWLPETTRKTEISLAQKPMQRPALSQFRLPNMEPSKKERLKLLEKLVRMPRPVITEMANNLGPAINAFAPEDEPLETFARRLIDYFDHEKSLNVLLDAVQRWSGETGFELTRVFISSDHQDRTMARVIAQTIKSLGYNVWFDEWKIHVGDSPTEATLKGIRESDVLLIVLSRNWLESLNGSLELGWWLGQHSLRNVLGFKIDDCEIPPGLSETIVADVGLKDITTKNVNVALKRCLQSL